MIPRQVHSARKTAMPIPKAKMVMTVRSMRHLLAKGMRIAGLRSMKPAPQVPPGAAVRRSIDGNASIEPVVLLARIPAFPRGKHDHHQQEKQQSASKPFHRKVFLP